MLRMKKKYKIILYSICLLCFTLVFTLLIYIYNADKYNSDLSDYYEGGTHQDNSDSVFDKITRNSKALIGKKGSQYIHSKIEERYLRTSLSENEIIERFLHGNTPMSIKGLDAWRLAVFNTQASYEALIEGLHSENPIMRRAIAIALGHSKFADAKDLIRSLLNDPDDSVVEGAIQALALLGDDDSIDIVKDILNDNDASDRIRIEAALALGNAETENSMKALMGAFNEKQTEELNDAIISSLGVFPFKETEHFFKDVVASEDLPLDLRTNAVEALADSTPEAIPFLFELTENSKNPDIRESAAWTIGVNSGTGEFADELTVLLKNENSEDVRRRLYESILSQDDIPTSEMIALAVVESTPAAQIAGANAVAASIGQNQNDSTNVDRFDRELLPAIKEQAIGAGSLNLRMRAVFALRRAHTPNSIKALQEISQIDDKMIAGVAQRALCAIQNDK